MFKMAHAAIATNSQKAWSMTKKIIGVLLIIAGIAGIFLPFLQGLLLIGIGVYLVGNHKMIDWFKQRLHKLKEQWKQRHKR